MSLRTLGAVKTGIKASRLGILSVSTHQICPAARSCSRHNLGKNVRSRKNSVSRPIAGCDSKLRASAASSSLRSIQIASGIDLPRVQFAAKYDSIGMLLLAKAFLDIALRRQTPANS